MKKIVFVCLGNICRSPLAEAIGDKIAKQNNYEFEIQSRGTGSWHVGEGACSSSVAVAKENGIDLSQHRAKQITKKESQNFDFFVALDHKNYEDLQAMGISNPLLLGDFGFDGADVPDPYFFNDNQGFKEVFIMIQTAVVNLLKSLNKKDSHVQ